MKQKLLVGIALVSATLGVSEIAARSLDAYNAADRAAIGTMADYVYEAVKIFPDRKESASTPLKAAATAEPDGELGQVCFDNAEVSKFLAAELKLSEAELNEKGKAAVEALSLDQFSAFRVKLARVIANVAVKPEGSALKAL